MAEIVKPVKLSSSEDELVQQFIHELSLENAFGDGILVSEEEAVKFLMARKFDVGRAISLFHTHQMVRGKFDLMDVDPYADPLASELQSGKFTVLNGKGKDGVTICLFYGKKHNPKDVEHVTVLRGVIFQLDCLMKGVDVQRNGVAFVYDMTDSTYANFDFDLAMKVLHLLKGGYPARLKNVYIVCPPLWFRTSMAVLTMFLRDKIRDRVELVKSHEELQRHIPKEVLPLDLGGISKGSHSDWIEKCVDYSKTSGGFNNMNANLSEVSPSVIVDSPYKNQTGIFEGGRSKVIDQNGSLSREPTPSPGSSPQTSKFQRIDKPPEKPLPPPPPDESGTNAHNISTILNDTMNEMEKFLQHNNEHIESFTQKKGGNVESLVSKLMEWGRVGLQKEYELLKGMAPTGAFVSTLYPINLRKNRYNNILAFEETRVKLEKIGDDPFSDYINANYVDGYLKKKKFICAQGPLPHTFSDFWRMIWEQKVLVIVMVTRCVERGHKKCGQYWPAAKDESISFGPLSVSNITCDIQRDYTCTLFELHNSSLELSRRVCHIQFTSWPDFGVPSSASPIIEVIDLIQQYQDEGLVQIRNESKSQFSKDMELSGEYENFTPTVKINSDEKIDTEDGGISPPPIVIHCSAGVGRTGTFCCISNCIEAYSTNNAIDIFQAVYNIRNQRAFSVQTADQYQFCYTGVIEYIIKDRREKGLETNDLESFLWEFIKSKSQSNN